MDDVNGYNIGVSSGDFRVYRSTGGGLSCQWQMLEQSYSLLGEILEFEMQSEATFSPKVNELSYRAYA